MLLEHVFFILLGLVVGSFLNVCIVRIPRQESIVLPRSRCPNCQAPVKPYDNIPVLSFLMLGGKCRSCRARISWQYPAVEATTALVFWATYATVGLQSRIVVLLLFFSALIALIFIDLNERILPDVITLRGMILGFVLSFFIPVEDTTAPFLLDVAGFSSFGKASLSFLNSLIGALVCGGFLWFVAELYFRLRGIEGLGFGDVKLMGMVGAFIGVQRALLTIMIGSLMGAVVGLIFIKLTGKDSKYELPFGSFLGIAAIFSALWGREFIRWYFGLGPG